MHLVLQYFGTVFLPFVTFLCIVVWCYRKWIAPYRGLPLVSVMMTFKMLLLESIPKNMTPNSYYFQRIIEMCKVHLSEGLCLFWLLHPYLFIFGEEQIKMFSNEQSALNKDHTYKSFLELLGDGLGTSKEDLWRKRRKMFNPAFAASMLKDNVAVVNRNASNLVTELTKVQNKSVQILKQLQFCAFSNTCDSVLGLDVREKKAEVEKFIDIMNTLGDIIVRRYLYPWLQPTYTLPFFSDGRKFLKTGKDFREFTAKILQEVKESELYRQRKAHVEETGQLHIFPRRTFVRVLVEHHLQDPSFTFKCMQDELATMAVGGSDTVSYALMWCLFLLGHDQEVQNNVFNELESVAEKDVTFDDLQKLTYMDCVVKETLRLFPPIPSYTRLLVENVQCGKYTIPKGTSIIFFTYLYHRNPKIYPDPEKFDPERFLDKNSERRPWTFIPFSEGIRNCIGKKFALMEMKIVLAHILRNFKVTSLDRKEDVKPCWEVILSTMKPLNMRFTPRQDSD